MTTRWIAEERGNFRRFEGDISAHPGFKGWYGGSHDQAFVLLEGDVLCVVHKQRARVSESRLCADNCKKAHPLTICHCICGGENHGEAYDGHLVASEGEEGAWDDYVDEVMAPGM